MLNELNLELQGKDRTVVDMISSVNAFKRRLHLLCSKLQRKDLANFQNIASELEKQGKDSALLDSARYTEQVNNITSDFEKRFRDFALLEPIATFMCYPFGEDHDIDSLAQNIGAVFHLNPSALEDEMLSLQADIQLKARAHAGQFWNLFRVEKYPNSAVVEAYARAAGTMPYHCPIP
ncbi:General transcription factor II-I repeat domain containing protein 2 [Dissostichus eleginoides]|uniref:General transcription factor II-I repeat domain containing protein 2 n=1 Tax=Dissostichus eleginoides TaxID=100907 RepID=A0AAD9CSE9_DISEL|nr:General transcription factor II-I repeat domain containing protein 2 [Dissostichus eleginoides]